MESIIFYQRENNLLKRLLWYFFNFFIDKSNTRQTGKPSAQGVRQVDQSCFGVESENPIQLQGHSQHVQILRQRLDTLVQADRISRDPTREACRLQRQVCGLRWQK